MLMNYISGLSLLQQMNNRTNKGILLQDCTAIYTTSPENVAKNIAKDVNKGHFVIIFNFKVCWSRNPGPIKQFETIRKWKTH